MANFLIGFVTGTILCILTIVIITIQEALDR